PPMTALLVTPTTPPARYTLPVEPGSSPRMNVLETSIVPPNIASESANVLPTTTLVANTEPLDTTIALGLPTPPDNVPLACSVPPSTNTSFFVSAYTRTKPPVLT